MGTLNRATAVLVIIGAINWGLIGFFAFDLVAAIFGGQLALLSRIIYALVGLSGIYQIYAMSNRPRTGTLATHDTRNVRDVREDRRGPGRAA
jgi:uncharacterized protein